MRRLRPLAAYLRSELGLAPSSDACRPLWAWDNSEAVLRRAAPLLAEVGYPVDELAREPALLCFSFEKRLAPRARLLAGMMARGELTVLPSLRLVATADDEAFRVAVELMAHERGR